MEAHFDKAVLGPKGFSIPATHNNMPYSILYSYSDVMSKKIEECSFVNIDKQVITFTPFRTEHSVSSIEGLDDITKSLLLWYKWMMTSLHKVNKPMSNKGVAASIKDTILESVQDLYDSDDDSAAKYLTESILTLIRNKNS